MSLTKPVEAAMFKTYCLGVGCMSKCMTCQHEQNWQTLNEMPDSLRKPMQAEMNRMDESYCQISSGQLYTPKV